MRFFLFLLVSSSAHALAAQWILAVSPAARRRKRIVVIVAASLSCVLALLRSVLWLVDSAAVRFLLAVAMVELASVALALVPLGIFALLLRGGARVVALAQRATAGESSAAPPSAVDEAEREGKRERLVTRREAIERTAGVTIFGSMSVALGWGIVRGRHAFVLEEVVVAVPGWPRALEGYTIAQVSDIHVGAFVGERELDEGFELVRATRPDLVVATGDIVDFDADRVGPVVERLLGVAARDGAYAILGNHDHYAGATEVAKRLRATKVRVLANEGVRLRAGDGGGFALLGVDDLHGRIGDEPGFTGPDLSQAVAGLSPDLPRILLAHQPRFFHEAAGRVALQLSGHTHGGQINPGFRPARAIMEFIAGRYEREGSTLWVNRGFGVVGPPSRVGAPPEVTKIVIVGA